MARISNSRGILQAIHPPIHGLVFMVYIYKLREIIVVQFSVSPVWFIHGLVPYELRDVAEIKLAPDQPGR
jgi:hypothetical protein